MIPEMNCFNLEDFWALKKQIEEWAIVPERMMFLPSAVVEGRVAHLKPVQKLYTYVFKMGGFISNYQYTGNNIRAEVQVPFPGMDGKPYPVTVYVELKPWTIVEV